MKRTLPVIVANYLKAHVQKKRWKQIVSVLACIVVFCTTYALILPAITMTGAYCGQEEHTHSVEAGCYTEGEAHVHTEDCYQEERVLTCGLAETEGHAHDDSCYDEDGNPVCEQEEAEAHTHTEDCYTVEKTLICGKEEGEAESVLMCTKEEHTHTLACYSNPDADLDEPRIPKLSGDAAADAALIAQEQIGYAQSTRNYLVAADGKTKYGYTCYGAAYGDSYTPNWSALFARFCLDKAGVSENFPRANTCDLWIPMLTEQELYQDAADYTPKTGDVAFFDLDGDGVADHAGIVLNAENAAVGAVTVQEDEADEAQSVVASLPFVDAVGFGTLPVKSPMKVTNAQPGKPTFDLTFSVGGHGAEGERLYYTGETFTATLSLSDNAQEGAQTSEDDGTVARVYMRFAKNVPDNENGVSSADGMPSVTGRGTITASGSGHQYNYTVTRIAGSDNNHYTYCFEIQRPINGDTLSIGLPCSYPSPTSAGGTVEVWGMLLTKEEKETLDGGSSTPAIQKPEAGTAATVRWETKPNDFVLTKTNATSSKLPIVGSDSDGKETITQLYYHINTKRSTTTELESIGKDYVRSVDFTDTFTLPENTHFDPEVIDAIKNHTYVYSSVSYDDSVDGHYTYYYVTQETKKNVFAISFRSSFRQDYTGPELGISEDGHTVTISWTKKNGLDERQEYFKHEFSDTCIGVQLPDIYIDKLEENLTYTVQNNVTATYHYCWSEDKTDTASCENTVQLGAAKMSYSKRDLYTSNDYRYGGSRKPWSISATNSGSLPYEHLAFIKDPLPSYLYMDADSLATAFADADYGKGFSVEIVNAAVCAGESLNVKTTDGGDAVATVTNVSPDVDGKYSGLWTGNDDTILTKTATFALGWNDDKAEIIITRSGDGISSQTRSCAPTAEAIQAALNELGLYVINETRYQVQWDLRDENGNPAVVHANQTLQIHLLCNNKDSFMRLTADRRNTYPTSSYSYTNAAEYQNENGEKIGSAQGYSYIYSEIDLRKSVAALDGSEITESNVPQDGDVLTYSLQLKHSGKGSYDLLPLVDHMTGAQVLLAEKEKNQGIEWASGCETVTVDSTEYYKLATPGTYQGVWINGLYADSVTVSKTDSGRETLIKWYFKDYDVGSKTQTFTYHAIVCPQELAVSGMTFSLNNESWLNDHVAHRLYADIGGEIIGSTVKFDKRIVSAADFGAAEKEEGQTHSDVGEGETVYYRISIYPSQVGGEDTGANLTLHGKDLRDSLPLSFSKNGTDYLKWHKGDDLTSGSVSILGYEGATSVSNPESWDIQDDGVANQQNLIWGDDFSVTFPANRPLYIYIRLTFPSGADWQEYAAQYSLTTLENAFSLNGVSSVVTHGLKVETKAYLQKGVYMNGFLQGSSVGFRRHQDLTTYSNTDADRNASAAVTYYVALCNEGNTRLYVSELQDILPDGFTIYYITTSTSRVAVQCTSGRNFVWKSLNISSTKDADNPQKLTWKITKTNSSSSISYDASRDMCYLNPGEGICFAYDTLVSENYADTKDTATNCVAMPYYDYNHGGVSLSDTKLTRKDSSSFYKGYVDVPNDGDCRLIDNTQAASAGFTGASNETQWLYSEVTQYRGDVKPGITKRLAAAISSETGTVTQNPISAYPGDTLRWEIVIYNDGSSGLSDYIVTDVMQYPYSFDGDVIFQGSKLFTIDFTPGNASGQIKSYNSTSFTVNGEWVRVVPIFSSDCTIYVRLTHDKNTGNYAISIRFSDVNAFGIVPGESRKLTIDTKRFDGGNENTVFINTCYVTPSADQAAAWDGTTNHGNVTAYDPTGEDENRLSVRNSAPVTTAYGFATSSRKDVAQTNDPTNSATSNDGTNYIVLPDLDTKGITYTLHVDAPDDVSMTSLVFIDTLPYVGDHSSFQVDDPRFSEFSVSFAADPNVIVKVTNNDGSVTTLDPSQYTVSYSSLTEFSKDDWKGTSTAGWQNTPTGMRTLRVAITDKDAIPAESHVSVSFDAIVGSEADYGQTAWNSFGYHYKVVSGVELEAAPLKVGVKMPTRPYLQKSLVDRDGKSTTAKKDETFRFLLYSGQSLKTTDVAKIAESGRDVSIIDLTVPQGASASEKLMLKDLKVWKYTDGKWSETETDWTWTHNGYYTLVELPQSDDPEYRFQSLNRRTDETGYQFVYQYDQTQQISAVNLHDVWPLTIRKVDQANPDLTIAGAWFALYSPYESDMLDYDALAEKPTNRPADKIEQDGQTWYLARVAQTGNVESERGSLTWSDLRRETYLYQEIQSPKGYMLDPTIRTVTKNGNPQTVTVTNEGAGYELPQTGGPGRLPFILSGLLLIGGTALVLSRRRKRKGAA